MSISFRASFAAKVISALLSPIEESDNFFHAKFFATYPDNLDLNSCTISFQKVIHNESHHQTAEQCVI